MRAARAAGAASSAEPAPEARATDVGDAPRGSRGFARRCSAPARARRACYERTPIPRPRRARVDVSDDASPSSQGPAEQRAHWSNGEAGAISHARGAWHAPRPARGRGASRRHASSGRARHHPVSLLRRASGRARRALPRHAGAPAAAAACTAARTSSRLLGLHPSPIRARARDPARVRPARIVVARHDRICRRARLWPAATRLAACTTPRARPFAGRDRGATHRSARAPPAATSAPPRPPPDLRPTPLRQASSIERSAAGRRL